ncbi:hypothetical protein [Belliella aquatica]|uniref:Uncharacterized protein n=1 Tax=Belliella aquatica TaxID=1323734 RepID=A0ABQ1LZX9_9BACT|nr:hypothetical protein [Belliella aquatica]MCH7406830.1 hypothetical protein [Belliella aquatica]GGC32392.1 hypothetical protein GCM10010993_09210 [Belliella aquatica]
MGKINSIKPHQKRDRLLKLIDLTGLTFLGFEVLLGYKSEGKYIHQIKNNNKEVSNLMIKKIQQSLKISAEIFNDTSIEFDKSEIQSQIEGFRNDNINSSTYFQKEDDVLLVINKLIRNGFFDSEKSGEEILKKFIEFGYLYSSEYLSGKLVNLLKRGVLKANKRRIILKNGKLGNKMVNYYRT